MRRLPPILIVFALGACGSSPSAPSANQPVVTAAAASTLTIAPSSITPPQEDTASPVKVPTEAPAIAPTTPPSASNRVVPTYIGEGRNQTVDPAWWPCKKGQIKGNRNSNVYHIPTGRDYAKTFRDVRCFTTPQEAEAAGYRAAQR